MNDTDIQEVAQTVTKQKRRPRPEQQPQLEPGDNTKYINHSLQLYRMSPVDMSDNTMVTQRIEKYFEICAADDMKPSVSGLALALGVDRSYLWQIREGTRGKNPDVANTLKRTMSLLDLQMVDYMQNGKINPVSGIFLMKNNFGYADKQEVVVTPQSPMGDTKDTKALEAEYVDSVVTDPKD